MVFVDAVRVLGTSEGSQNCPSLYSLDLKTEKGNDLSKVRQLLCRGARFGMEERLGLQTDSTGLRYFEPGLSRLF